MVWGLFGSDEGQGGPADSSRNSQYHPTHKHVIGEDMEKSIDEALECDYERDCTTLYRKIEDEEWGYVTRFLDSGYWPGSFFADAIAPADQARTWVTRFDPHDAKKVRWSQLPLHLAIVVDAPYEIVGRLIELYPQAVRCTDDQHMLPLHLAMRHGSSDRIVDLLLAAFPEAVNARGKNDRTPIECAIRGPNKVRGRILGAFVEKSKAKATKSAVSAYTREIAHLKAQLEDKETELSDVRSKLLALDTAKASIEFELNQKISELKVSQAKMQQSAAKRVEKVESAHLIEELEIQKKINELEAEKQQLEVAQQKAKEEESGLRKELETVQLHVVQSTSPDDLHDLKEEVQSLKAYRLENSRSQVKEEMEALKKQLANEVKKADGATRNELKVMQKTIDELRCVSTKAKSNDDIMALKAELEALRKELKDREEASRTKVDLVLLKKQLEKELKDTENKTSEQIAAIQAAIKDMNIAQLETKTHGELTALKKELEALKQDMKERELETRTKKELEELKEQVNKQLKCSEGKTKMELHEMKKAVESININDLEFKTNEELIAVKRELEELKEQLQKKEETNKVKFELATLRKSFEFDLRNSSGTVDHVHIQAMEMAVKRASEPTIDSKTAEELKSLKEELESLKDEMKLKEDATETKAELEALKVQVEEQLKASEGKTKDELLTIKNAVDKINMTGIESKNREQFDAMKKELGSVRQSLTDKQVSEQLKLELTVLRTALEAELAHNKGQNQAEVAALQRSVDNLQENKLQDKSAEELSALKQEVTALKQEMKEKDDAVKDLENLKQVVEDKLAASEGKTKEELQALKAAVDAIDLKRDQSQSSQEWLVMKEELAVLKRKIYETELAKKTKTELNKLKQSLEEEMKQAPGSTKDELEKMKAAVDSIDLEKLETASQPAWVNLNKDVESLKRQLKVKECQGLMANMNEALRHTKGMSRLEINRVRRILSEVDVSKLESMSYDDLCAKKREIEAIREEIDADSVSKTHKAEKKGFRKMLMRWAFGGKKGKSDSTPSTPEKNRSTSETETEIDEAAGLVMPPSMVSCKRSMADSDEDSEEDTSRKSEAKRSGGLPPRAPSSKTKLASRPADPPKLVPDCCDPRTVRPGLTTVDPQQPAAGEATTAATSVEPSDPTPPGDADPAPPSTEMTSNPAPASDEKTASGIQSLIKSFSKDSRASAKSEKVEGAVSKAKGCDDAASDSSKRSISSKPSVSSKRSVSSKKSSTSKSSKTGSVSSKKSSISKSSKSSRKSKMLTSTPKSSPLVSRSGTPNPTTPKPNSRPATPVRSASPDSANDTAPESPVTPVPMTDAPVQPAEEAPAELSNLTMVNETCNGEMEVEIASLVDEAPAADVMPKSPVEAPISAATL